MSSGMEVIMVTEWNGKVPAVWAELIRQCHVSSLRWYRTLPACVVLEQVARESDRP